MKILIVIDKIEIGGITSLVASTIDYLHAHGLEVVILGSRGQDYCEARSYFKNVKIYDYPVSMKKSWLMQLQIILETDKYIKKIINTEKPNVIHLTTTLSGFGTLINLSVRKLPIVYDFYGAWDLEVDSRMQYFASAYANQGRVSKVSYSHKVKSYIRFLMQRWVLMKADGYIVLSDYAKNLMLTHFKLDKNMKKVVVIPGSIEKQISIREIDRAALRKKWGFNEERMVITMISRPDPRKGLHLAIEAMRILVAKGLRVTLIIGLPDFEGTYYERLLQQIEEIKKEMDFEQMLAFSQAVHLVKVPKQKDRQRLMQAADIFLMASIDLETFGLTTIEAMAEGTVVVGTPTGATPEILGQIHSVSLLTDKVSPEFIAGKIEVLAKLSPKRLNQIRGEERKLVGEIYTIQKTHKELISFYKELITKKKKEEVNGSS